MIQIRAKALGALIAVLALNAVLVLPGTAFAEEVAPTEEAAPARISPPVVGKGVHPDSTDFGYCRTGPGVRCEAVWTQSTGFATSHTSYSDGASTQTTQYCGALTCTKSVIANPNSPTRAAVQIEVTGPNVSLIYVGPVR
jgi:hypothetical protein